MTEKIFDFELAKAVALKELEDTSQNVANVYKELTRLLKR